MCGYSLLAMASRPARVGDKLTIMRFPHALTRGFFAAGEPDVAVCLSPGTELVFDDEAERDHPLAWLPRFRFGKVGEKLARFRQIKVTSPYAHHDAVEFANGKVVLVTRLCLDQRATVLQLPVQTYLTEESSQPLPLALTPQEG
jgi:hypothetical protein